MATLFLIIIFLAFISLGLPDSGLGVAWPFMRVDLGVPLEALGLITIITTLCGAISSIVVIRLAKIWDTGMIVTMSALFTGLAMLGFTLTNQYFFIVLCAIPLGFGAGGVDATLNNYVSHHYSSKIMNWLHACWGLGSMISPLIMTYALTILASWKSGFLVIAWIQISLGITFLIFFRLRKKQERIKEEKPEATQKTANKSGSLKTLTPWLAIFSFFLYCGMENSIGAWLQSLLIESRHFEKELSGSIVAMYFGGIMLGRFISGFISNRLGNRKLVRMGMIIAFIGTVLFVFPSPITSGISVLLIGLGFAPIFPSLMHETSLRFNKNDSSKVISYEMAAANIAMCTITPLMGVLGSRISIELLPWLVLVMAGLLLLDVELLNRKTKYE